MNYFRQQFFLNLPRRAVKKLEAPRLEGVNQRIWGAIPYFLDLMCQHRYFLCIAIICQREKFTTKWTNESTKINRVIQKTVFLENRVSGGLPVLERKKSWEPFRSFLPNSTANPAHFNQNWAGLAVLYSRQILNGSQDFFFSLIFSFSCIEPRIFDT